MEKSRRKSRQQKFASRRRRHRVNFPTWQMYFLAQNMAKRKLGDVCPLQKTLPPHPSHKNFYYI